MDSTTEISGRVRRIQQSLTPREWAAAGGMIAAVLALHVIGWGVLLLIVVPGHYSVGTQTFGAGIGLTAYTLGMRHAFDADHISAIDNTTRKLMADGKRPLTVGFWFSLGHSSVVFALSLLLSLGIRALAGPARSGNSTLHQVTNLVGTGISGGFLYLIAIINVVVLAGILKAFRGVRRGQHDALEEHFNAGGLVTRVFRKLMTSVRTPGQMYGVGLLFGLGFDTATEVALLVLAGSGAASGLPWYAILTMPVLFAAGMSLLDAIDGSFMNFAYGWAFSNPVRKVYYNITITGLSVIVALLIGTAELASLAAQELSLGGPFWGWVSGLNLNTLGFAIVGLFIATWAVALTAWRVLGLEQRLGGELPRSLPSRNTVAGGGGVESRTHCRHCMSHRTAIPATGAGFDPGGTGNAGRARWGAFRPAQASTLTVARASIFEESLPDIGQGFAGSGPGWHYRLDRQQCGHLRIGDD